MHNLESGYKSENYKIKLDFILLANFSKYIFVALNSAMQNSEFLPWSKYQFKPTINHFTFLPVIVFPMKLNQGVAFSFSLKLEGLQENSDFLIGSHLSNTFSFLCYHTISGYTDNVKKHHIDLRSSLFYFL